MELAGRLVNNTYNVKALKKESCFYSIWEAVSIFSANPLLLYVFREPVSALSEEELDDVRKHFFKAYDIQTPYLYKPFETGTFEDQLFFVYLEIESITLRTLIDTGVRLPFEIVLKIVINILRALKQLEKRGLRHNMITPDTVWLTETGPEITNIKLSGFLDYLLWPHLGRERKDFLKRNIRYLRKPLQESGNIKPEAENDIYSTGAILAEMLTGRPFPKEGGVKLPDKTPAWLKETMGRMIDSPESFSTIEDLLEIFISNSPEHSILEDSIEERIVDTHQGGNYEKLIDPEDEAVEVEEIDRLIQETDSKAAKTVKNIVSFIFSFFRKKKKGIPPADSREASNQQDNEEPQEDTSFSEPADRKSDEDFPETRHNEPETVSETENNLTIDPWDVDKNRYRERDTEEKKTSIPVNHNRAEMNTEKGTGEEGLEREHGTYDVSKTPSFTIHEKTKTAAYKEMSTEERVAAMNRHRENTAASPEVPDHNSISEGQSVYSSPEESIKKAPDHPVETRIEKTLSRHGKTSNNSRVPDASAPAKNPDTAAVHISEKNQKKKLSFLQKLIRQLKKLLHL